MIRYFALALVALTLLIGCGSSQEVPPVANEEIIYLVEVTAYDPGTSGTTILRYTTGRDGFTTRPGDTPANTYYEPRVNNPGNFQRTMFGNLTTAGSSASSYGEVVLNNKDGALDGLLYYGFDGRRVAILAGPRTGSYADFVPVMVGTMQQVLPNWSEVTIQFRDRAAELKTAFQPTKYAGDNALPAGLEGVGTDLKGKPKPRLLGKVYNVAPPCVNTSRLIYQVNNGSMADIPNVYDKGAALTRGTDYTSQTDMETTAPAAGQYRCWLAGGYFRLGASPAGQITADGIQGNSSSVVSLIQIVIEEKIATSDISYSDLSRLQSTNWAEVGIYVDTETTSAAVLDELAGSVGAWWGFDNTGMFRIQRLDAPSASGEVTTITDILSLQRMPTNDIGQGVPVWKVNLSYQKNYTVQTDVATSVTDARKAWLKEQYRVSSASSSAVLNQFLLAGELSVDTLLVSDVAAEVEAARRLSLYGARRDAFRVDIPMQAFRQEFAGIWDTNALTDLTGGNGTYYSYWSEAKEYNGYLYAIGAPDGYGTGTKLVRISTADPTGVWSTVATVPSGVFPGYSDFVFHNGYLYVVGGSGTLKTYRLNLSDIGAGWDDAGITDLPAIYLCKAVVVDNWLYVKTFINGGTASKLLRLDLTAPTGAWDDAGVSDMTVGTNNPLMYYDGYFYTIYTYANDSRLYRLSATSPTSGWAEITISPRPPVTGPHCLMGSYIYMGINQYYYITGEYDSAVYRLNLAATAAGWEKTYIRLPNSAHRFTIGIGLGNLITIFNTTFPIAGTYLWRPMSNYAAYAYLWDIGRIVRIDSTRYGLADRVFVIIGHQPDYQRGVVTLDIWG